MFWNRGDSDEEEKRQPKRDEKQKKPEEKKTKKKESRKEQPDKKQKDEKKQKSEDRPKDADKKVDKKKESADQKKEDQGTDTKPKEQKPSKDSPKSSKEDSNKGKPNKEEADDNTKEDKEKQEKNKEKESKNNSKADDKKEPNKSKDIKDKEQENNNKVDDQKDSKKSKDTEDEDGKPKKENDDEKEPQKDDGKDDERENREDSVENDSQQEGSDDEYGFIPDKEEGKASGKAILRTILRIISSAPIFVSYLSLSHFIRGISYSFLSIGVILMMIHYIISFVMAAKILEDTYSPSPSYSALSYDSFMPLSFFIDAFIVVMKFFTCLFYMDLFLESFYAIFPSYRISSYDFGLSKTMWIVVICVFFLVVIFAYNLSILIQFSFDLMSIISAFVILTCVWIYSKMDTKHILEANTSSSTNNKEVTLKIFVVFSFLSFALECQTTNAFAVRKSRSSSMVVGILSIFIVGFFALSLFYFGKWMMQYRLKEVLEYIMPSSSNVNVSLHTESNKNVLPYSFTIATIVLALTGFIINLGILGNSMFSIFSVSETIAAIVVAIISFFLIIMVIYDELGKILWYFSRVIFFLFPIYAMYPYLTFLFCREKSKVLFIFSILACLAVSFLIFLACMDILSIDQSIFKY